MTKWGAKYNVRGWPTEINEPRMSQKIYYNENLPQGVTPLYNGNIPCLSNTADNNLTSHFVYDGLNRLVATKQYRPDGRFIETPEKFTYDKMGNVLTIERSYYDPYPDYLNEMTIQYHGNQIKKVTDESRGHDYYVLRYQDAANKDIEYFYDSNGNLVKNLDNKIGFIKYNIINLPEAVAFNDGNLLTYSYMADGRKVRDSYGSFPIRTSTPLDSIVNNTDPYITQHNDWSEDYYYSSGRLYRITTPEGFIRFVNRVGYSIYYSMKDHVGSFRGYWEPGYTNGPITFSYPSYHPSGIIYRKPYPDVPFALGGKEFMGTNNLDEYFFGARTMYAIMNRFNQMDPLCEKYYSVSPYAYCMNNPVRYMDPDGRDIVISGVLSNEALRQLQDRVGNGLTLSMSTTGTVSYMVNTNKKLRGNARRMVRMIDDNSITVNLITTDKTITSTGNLLVGGAFMGNVVTEDSNGKTKVVANQEVNPNILGSADEFTKTPGKMIMHETTEAYEGAKISQNRGIGVSYATDADLMGHSVYKKAHNRATPQSNVYQNMYDRNGQETNDVSQAVRVVWSVSRAGKLKIIQTLP